LQFRESVYGSGALPDEREQGVAGKTVFGVADVAAKPELAVYVSKVQALGEGVVSF
jgi:hypothetical protein